MNKLRMWAQRYRKPLIAFVVWGGAFLLARQYMLANGLAVGDLVADLRELLTGTWYGPLIYILAYLLRPILLLPASLMTALAGTVFGLGLGFLYGMIAGTLSCVLPYGVGRWASNAEESVPVQQKDFSRLQKFIQLIQQNPFRTILTMRLLYLPYDAVSILAGSLKIRFAPFIIATTLGNLGGTFAYVALGASVEGDLTENSLSFDPAILLISAVIFIVSMGASRLLRAKSDSESDQDNEKSVEKMPQEVHVGEQDNLNNHTNRMEKVLS